MSTAASAIHLSEADFDSSSDTSGLGGQPAGLTTLFFTEMWERFSYYGMRAILILYMVALPVEGGLGMDMEKASEIYGNYTMLVYLSCIPGGYIADKFLGQRLSILIGGIVIALGHFTLAFRPLPFFFSGLAIIILGTGLLKPNMSTLVGKLYSKNDNRRDAGFSIYYMGINIGAGLSPLVCGTLAQAKEFKQWLVSVHLDPLDSWHWGFAAAGVGMSFGLLQFVLQKGRLGNIGAKPSKIRAGQAQSGSAAIEITETTPSVPLESIPETEPSIVHEADSVVADLAIAHVGDHVSSAASKTPLTKIEWMKLGALGILFLFTILFWAVYEQGGSSLNVFADRLTACEFFGFEFPSSWFQALQGFMVIFFAPVFSWLWLKLGDKEPSSPAKFAYGLALLALGIGAMVPASMLAAHGKVGPFWLSLCYLLMTFGELCLSPVGLSTVTKLAPAKIAAMTMGIWFLGPAFGNKLAGFLAGFFKDNDTSVLVYLYGGMTAATLLATIILVALAPVVRKLMSGVK